MNGSFLIIDDVFVPQSNSSASVTVEIANIINPYSLTPLAGLEVYVQSALGGIALANISSNLSATTPSKPKVVSIVSSEPTVDKYTNFTVQVSPLNYFNKGDSIELTFPSVKNLTQSGKNYITIRFNISVLDDTFRVGGLTSNLNSSTKFAIQNQTVILSQVVGAYTESILSFHIIGIKNVKFYTMNTSFQINVKDSKGNLIAQQLDGIPYTTAPGDVVVQNFEASTQKISASSDYTFSFSVETALTQGTPSS